MSDPTYPVLRSGVILKASRQTGPADAIKTARVLRTENNNLSNALVEVLSEIATPKLGTNSADMALRVRLLPAVTIDFAPLRFEWEGQVMEFRACATVCSGSRQAKTWVRYNICDELLQPNIVLRFFRDMKRIDHEVHKACLDFYNNCIQEAVPGLKFTQDYKCRIQMVSARNDAIRSIVEKGFSTIPSRRQGGENAALKLIEKQLGPSAAGFIPQKHKSTDRKIVGFRYPRNKTVELEDGNRHKGVGKKNKSSERKSENFEAICIVDINDKLTDVVGVAHESSEPENYRRSATHIVSGEISFEIGNVY